MFALLYFILINLIFALLTFYAQKNKFLLNNTGEIHQNFAIKKVVPLTGGILLLLSIFYDFFAFKDILITISILFILGIISDLKVIKSSSLRFLLQTIIIISYIYFSDLQIYSTRVQIIDRFLDNYYFNIFFVTFCILIVVNGSNFIDGMNSLTSTYYIIVLAILYKLQYFDNLIIQENSFYMLHFSLIVLIFLNFKSKIFLGDSGSYILGFIFSIILINLYLNNPELSPFLIVLLLWYPCFENLFSILRKFNFKRSPLSADKNHFHQLIFFYIRKKYNFSILTSNNLTSCVINFVNLIILFLGSGFPSHSQTLIIYITIAIILYSILYIKLLNLKFKKII